MSTVRCSVSRAANRSRDGARRPRPARPESLDPRAAARRGSPWVGPLRTCSSGLSVGSSPRFRRASGEDRLPKRRDELRVGRDAVTRPLASIPEVRPSERQMIAILVDEPSEETEIDELAHRVDADAVANLELCFAERRRHFVLRNLDACPTTDELVADLHLSEIG